MSNTTWVSNPNFKHTSFSAHGSSTVTALILWNDHIISASDDHSIHIHTTDGQLIRSLEGHEAGVWALALHGGTLVSGAADKTTRIWDLQTGNCRHVFRRHTSTVRCIVIAEPEESDAGPKQSLIVTGSRDRTLCVWALPGPEDAEYKDIDGDEVSPDVVANPYHLFHLEGHEDTVRSISARGRIAASASYDNTVRIWDLIKGECLWVLTGHTNKVYDIVLDPLCNHAYSGSMDGTVRVWDLSNGSCSHVLSHHKTIVALLSMSPSFLLSADANGLVCVWNPKSGDLVQTFQHNFTVTAIQHDDSKALTGSDGLVRVLDLQSGKTLDLLSEERSRVASRVAFAGSLCVAVTKEDTTFIDVWKFKEDGNSY